MSPKIKINAPEDLSDEVLIKALEHSISELSKGEESTDLLSELGKENSALEHLTGYIRETYKKMATSMAKEIQKVLKPK